MQPVVRSQKIKENYLSSVPCFSVYVIGGCAMMENSEREVTLVESFNTTTNEWTRKNMKEARSHFAVTTHQDMIYVFGGRRNAESLDTCERYVESL